MVTLTQMYRKYILIAAIGTHCRSEMPHALFREQVFRKLTANYRQASHAYIDNFRSQKVVTIVLAHAES